MKTRIIQIFGLVLLGLAMVTLPGCNGGGSSGSSSSTSSVSGSAA